MVCLLAPLKGIVFSLLVCFAVLFPPRHRVREAQLILGKAFRRYLAWICLSLKWAEGASSLISRANFSVSSNCTWQCTHIIVPDTKWDPADPKCKHWCVVEPEWNWSGKMTIDVSVENCDKGSEMDEPVASSSACSLSALSPQQWVG